MSKLGGAHLPADLAPASVGAEHLESLLTNTWCGQPTPMSWIIIPSTVDCHLRKVFRTDNVKSRAQLARRMS